MTLLVAAFTFFATQESTPHATETSKQINSPPLSQETDREDGHRSSSFSNTRRTETNTHANVTDAQVIRRNVYLPSTSEQHAIRPATVHLNEAPLQQSLRRNPNEGKAEINIITRI